MNRLLQKDGAGVRPQQIARRLMANRFLGGGSELCRCCVENVNFRVRAVNFGAFDVVVSACTHGDQLSARKVVK
jgi:hypothetical protein